MTSDSPERDAGLTSGPLVRVRGLTRMFGANRALDGVDLDLPPGAVGLLGPNGAGKSTLLRILLGLLAPTSGTASVLGVDPASDPVEARRRVGYMPEGDSYVTGITGVEAVTLAGELCGLPRRNALQRAHGVLGYVGLGEIRYRKVEEYSTGLRQRVRLAQALVHDPDLLLLDEPTNGLDPGGRDEILEVIRDLAAGEGKNVVLCSHLLRDVERTCDHVVVLTSGRVTRQGTLEEIRGDRRDVYRVTARGDRAALEASLRAADLRPEVVEGAVRVAVPAGAGATPILRAAAAAGIDIRAVVPDGVSLEEAFLAAVEADGDGA